MLSILYVLCIFVTDQLHNLHMLYFVYLRVTGRLNTDDCARRAHHLPAPPRISPTTDCLSHDRARDQHSLASPPISPLRLRDEHTLSAACSTRGWWAVGCEGAVRQSARRAGLRRRLLASGVHRQGQRVPVLPRVAVRVAGTVSVGPSVRRDAAAPPPPPARRAHA